MHRSIPVAALAAVALCAACGTSAPSKTASSKASDASDTSGRTAAAAQHGSPAAKPMAGGGKLINVCQVLPIAKASQIVGKAFTSAKPHTYSGQISKCEYSGGSELLQVSVSIRGGKMLLNSDADALKQIGHPANQVSGVGDAAISEPDPKGNAGSVGAAASTSFAAVFGDAYMHIGGLTYVTPDQGKQIVELLHAAM